MEYRRLGKSGLKVSTLSLGSWVTFGNQIDDSTATDLMKMAYEAGVNFFDNAEAYAQGKSEIVMGNILKKFGWHRSTFIVSSKVFFGTGGAFPGDKRPNQTGLSRKHVFEACEAALKRLQVDYLDLYFCHRPDPETPIEETVRAMSDLVHQGKVLYWGTSEWSAAQIADANGIALQHHLVPPTMEQPQYNMLHRKKVEFDYLPLYEKPGIGTTIWSPLASGILTDKYLDGKKTGTRLELKGLEWLEGSIIGENQDERLGQLKKLQAIASGMGVSLARFAIAWCASNRNVSTVILGASKPAQLKETLTSLEIIDQLTDDVCTDIDEILGNKPGKK